MFLYLFLSFPALVRCDVHHHHFLFLFFLLFLLLLLRSSALEDSIKQYEQDLARKLYQSRQWAPAPRARPAQMSSPMQSHASRIPGSGSQSRCAQPPPCQLHAQQSCLYPYILMQCSQLWPARGREEILVVAGVHFPEVPQTTGSCLNKNEGGFWVCLFGRREQAFLRPEPTFS